MKALKLGLTVAVSAFILFAAAALPKRLCFDGGERYTFYCGTSSADCREIAVNANAAFTRLTLKNICGEAAEYSRFCLNEFLESVNGKIVFTEELSDSFNYYCTASLPYSVNIRGCEINLHICVRDGKTKVASPIIFGGY